MDPLTIAAASGLRARMESLDLLANNLANAATVGYKADREFYDLYRAAEASDGPDAARLPLIERQWTDYSQGVLTATANPLDLALDGRGFFAVNGPGGVLYTRGGTLRTSPDGTLVTQQGYAVRDVVDGQPVRLDKAQPFEITRDGAVHQAGRETARLEVVDFAQPEALAKLGGSYFHMTDPAQRARPATADVHQAKLEAANFSPAESAVRLVSLLRQFEMLQRALVMGGEMNRRAVEEVARVS